MIAKLRPVGSLIPAPTPARDLSVPWADLYDTEFTNSGTAALSLAIACAIAARPESDGPEVIFPAYGCPDLIAAAVAQGAKPVLVDLLPGKPWLDPELVSAALTSQTVAIVAANFLGLHEQLEKLGEIARSAGVALIEDSAQRFPPASAASGLADFVVLSFGRGKPINLGGGGALLVRKDKGRAAIELIQKHPAIASTNNGAWRLRRLVFNHLLSRMFYGLLERMPFLGIGETRYKRLERIERQQPVGGHLSAGITAFWQRPMIGNAYNQSLADLQARGWTLLPLEESRAGTNEAAQPPLLRYGLLAPSPKLRDSALLALNARGISASAFYGRALPELPGVLPHLPQTHTNYPQARDFASRLMTLPTHEDVLPADIALITETLLNLKQ